MGDFKVEKNGILIILQVNLVNIMMIVGWKV